MLRIKACLANSGVTCVSDLLTTSLPRRDFNARTVKLQRGMGLASKTKCLSSGGEFFRTKMQKLHEVDAST